MGAELPRTTQFQWTTARETAAGKVAEGKLSDEAIAAEAGVTRKTLYTWRQRDEFKARVDELIEAAKAAARAQTIANKETRVRRLAERASLIDEVIAARADEHKDVPGGSTGLLVREPKIVKVYDVDKPRRRRGPSSVADEDEGDDDRPEARGDDDERLTPSGGVVIVYEYKVDTGTLAELRRIEQQAAQELGEWTEKKELTGKDGVALAIKAYVGFDLDEV